jgi:hypothetical protein
MRHCAPTTFEAPRHFAAGRAIRALPLFFASYIASSATRMSPPASFASRGNNEYPTLAET